MTSVGHHIRGVVCVDSAAQLIMTATGRLPLVGGRGTVFFTRYIVIYRVVGDHIVVRAIADARRRHEAW